VQAFAWYDHLTRKIGFGDGEEEPVEATATRSSIMPVTRDEIAAIRVTGYSLYHMADQDLVAQAQYWVKVKRNRHGDGLGWAALRRRSP